MPSEEANENANVIDVEKSRIQQRFSGIPSFIAMWTRIRVLITRTFRVLCGCSSTLRSHAIRRSSFPIEELTELTGMCKHENAPSLYYQSQSPRENNSMAKRKLSLSNCPTIAESCHHAADDSLSLIVAWYDSMLQFRDRANLAFNTAISEQCDKEIAIVTCVPFSIAKPKICSHMCPLVAPKLLTRCEGTIEYNKLWLQNQDNSVEKKKMTLESASVTVDSGVFSNDNGLCNFWTSSSSLPVDDLNKNSSTQNVTTFRKTDSITPTNNNSAYVPEFVDSLILNAQNYVNKLNDRETNIHLEIVSECQGESKFVAGFAPSGGDELNNEEDNEISILRSRLLSANLKTKRSKSPPPTPYELRPSVSEDEPEDGEDSVYCSYESPLPYEANSLVAESFLSKSNRHTSMKSEHSPLYIPVKKLVRFADCMGLNLAYEREVFDLDKPPRIPASALQFLNLELVELHNQADKRQFRLDFPQPSASSNFIRRVLENGIVLENAEIDSNIGQLTGTIRVRGFGAEKNVAVRMTYNNWENCVDIRATSLSDSFDGATERFIFSNTLPPTITSNSCIYFALFYTNQSGETLWDNNFGENYPIICSQTVTEATGQEFDTPLTS